MRFYQRKKVNTRLLMQLLTISAASGLLIACFHKTLPIAATNPSLSWDARQTTLQQLTNWTVKGKAAFQSQEDSGSATFSWQQTPSAYTFTAYDPLGGEVFNLQGNRQEAALSLANGKRYFAHDSEELFVRAVHVAFPLASLHYWVRGLPDPNYKASSEFDSSHRLSKLSQADWHVDFQNYTVINNIELPRFIVMTSPRYKAKVMVYDWQIQKQY